MAQFAVTYDITTHESAEHGDCEESGFIDSDMTLREAIAAVLSTRTCHVDGITAIEPNESPAIAPSWVTVTNGMEYLTGAYEQRALHMPDTLTPATRRRICRLVGARV
jgi:hypothetical protein